MREFIAATAVFLSACGGGGGDEMRALPGPAPEVLLLGDSTQRGSLDGTSPAKFASEILGASVTLRNEGVSGSSAWHLQQGLEEKHTAPFSQTLKQQGGNVRAIALRYGINDTQLYSAAQFAAVMADLVAQIELSGRVAIIETPNPVDVAMRPELAGVGERAQALRAIAGKHPKAVLCDHNRLAFEKGYEGELFDGVHPTEAGHRIHGATLAGCIRQALGR